MSATLPADYTPPTLEQRLDAAAAEWRRNAFGGPPDWAQLPESMRLMYRKQAELVCRAFAPEHFKDTDTTTGKD